MKQQVESIIPVSAKGSNEPKAATSDSFTKHRDPVPEAPVADDNSSEEFQDAPSV